LIQGPWGALPHAARHSIIHSVHATVTEHGTGTGTPEGKYYNYLFLYGYLMRLKNEQAGKTPYG
jgi:hypothetical protein